MNAISFRATEFEFRHRVWFIAGIFCVGFLCYGADHVNVSAALLKMIRGSGGSQNLNEMDTWMRAFFIFAAFLAACAALVRTWASAYLHSSVVYDSTLHPDRLVADGPYRHLRNPLYLGTVLLNHAFFGLRPVMPHSSRSMPSFVMPLRRSTQVN
jgi:protein-S-isoprenylcysteine O-methyltransferase Ste14